MTYFDAIAKIVSERTGCDVSAVKPESKFSELGIDSLDTVELLMSLEDEIGIEIELDQIHNHTRNLIGKRAHQHNIYADRSGSQRPGSPNLLPESVRFIRCIKKRL
mgnify:CR=1 FL=1